MSTFSDELQSRCSLLLIGSLQGEYDRFTLRFVFRTTLFTKQRPQMAGHQLQLLHLEDDSVQAEIMNSYIITFPNCLIHIQIYWDLEVDYLQL